MRSIMVHSCSRAFCRQHWASDSVSSLYIFQAQLVLFVDMQHLSIFLRPTLSLSGHQGDRRRTCIGAWRNAAPEVAQRRALFDAMVAAPTPQPSHNNNITMNSQSRWSPTHAANFAAPSQSRAPRWILHKADPTGEGGGCTKKVNLFQRSRHPTRVPSTPALAHAPTTHQPHRAPTNAPALFKFGLAHNARAWNSFCGTGFCAIRVCISPSCLDTPHCALRVAAFNSLYPDPNHGAKSS